MFGGTRKVSKCNCKELRAVLARGVEVLVGGALEVARGAVLVTASKQGAQLVPITELV